jgi:hypothetical protein
VLFAPEGIVGGDLGRRLRSTFSGKKRGDDGTGA